LPNCSAPPPRQSAAAPLASTFQPDLLLAGDSRGHKTLLATKTGFSDGQSCCRCARSANHPSRLADFSANGGPLPCRLNPCRTETPSHGCFGRRRSGDRRPGEGDQIFLAADQQQLALPAAVDCLELVNEFSPCRGMACPLAADQQQTLRFGRLRSRLLSATRGVRRAGTGPRHRDWRAWAPASMPWPARRRTAEFALAERRMAAQAWLQDDFASICLS